MQKFEKELSDWKLRLINKEIIPCKLPSTAYREIDGNSSELLKRNIEYFCSFDLYENFPTDNVFLSVTGVYGYAQIYFNGSKILETTNINRCYEVDITKAIKKSGNIISVNFPSRIPAGVSRLTEDSKSNRGMLGKVSVLGYKYGRIERVFINQIHLLDCVKLHFSVNYDHFSDLNPELEIEIFNPQGDLIYSGPHREIEIKNPQLWYPNGYGKQNLYKVKVTFSLDGETIDTWEKKIGLRNVKLITEENGGEAFRFEVNGERIFARGASFNMLDSELAFLSDGKIRKLLEDCRQQGINTLHVSGSGVYPNNSFYDACDELGIMLWQDLLTADEFSMSLEDDIKEEIEFNVNRLMHHPSIVLWCGNSGIEKRLAESACEKSEDFKLRADYIKIYEYIIPKIIKNIKTQTPYRSSTPSSAGGFDAPNDFDRGDCNISADDIVKLESCLFVSAVTEPSLSHVEGKNLNIFSPELDFLQRDKNISARLIENIGDAFKMPDSFEKSIYASQLVQAERIRELAEKLRCEGIVSGILLGSLIDMTPKFSDSMIENSGRLKPLYYYAKRFFLPVLLMCKILDKKEIECRQTGLLKEKHCIAFVLSNDSRISKFFTIKWSIRGCNGNIIKSERISLSVNSHSVVKLDEIILEEFNESENYISFELYDRYELIQEGTLLLTSPKRFDFKDPNFKLDVVKDYIIIKSNSYAKGIEIQNSRGDLVLSDNYFDINRKEKRVKILSGESIELQIKSMYDLK